MNYRIQEYIFTLIDLSDNWTEIESSLSKKGYDYFLKKYTAFSEELEKLREIFILLEEAGLEKNLDLENYVFEKLDNLNHFSVSRLLFSFFGLRSYDLYAKNIEISSSINIEECYAGIFDVAIRFNMVEDSKAYVNLHDALSLLDEIVFQSNETKDHVLKVLKSTFTNHYLMKKSVVFESSEDLHGSTIDLIYLLYTMYNYTYKLTRDVEVLAQVKEVTTQSSYSSFEKKCESMNAEINRLRVILRLFEEAGFKKSYEMKSYLSRLEQLLRFAKSPRVFICDWFNLEKKK